MSPAHESPIDAVDLFASAEVADRLFAPSASGDSGDGSGVPTACRRVAHLVAVARRPENCAASDRTAVIVGAMAATVTGCATGRLRRRATAARLLTAKVVVGATLTIGAASAAALTGQLPPPAQDAVSQVAAYMGIDRADPKPNGGGSISTHREPATVTPPAFSGEPGDPPAPVGHAGPNHRPGCATPCVEGAAPAVATADAESSSPDASTPPPDVEMPAGAETGEANSGSGHPRPVPSPPSHPMPHGPPPNPGSNGAGPPPDPGSRGDPSPQTGAASSPRAANPSPLN